MSTVIKAGQGGALLRSLSRVDLADHLAEARAVVERARREAEGILAAARQAAEKTKSAAYGSGYDVGYPQGIEEGRKAGHEQALREASERFATEQSGLIAAMSAALSEFDAIKRDVRLEAERHLLEFAVRAACKLTFEIGGLHREAAMENVQRAIRTVGSKTDLTICVHPSDAAALETFAEAVLRQAAGSPHVRIAADESLAPGGCRVTAGNCEIDATLETQTAQLAAVLLGGAPPP